MHNIHYLKLSRSLLHIIFPDGRQLLQNFPIAEHKSTPGDKVISNYNRYTPMKLVVIEEIFLKIDPPPKKTMTKYQSILLYIIQSVYTAHMFILYICRVHMHSTCMYREHACITHTLYIQSDVIQFHNLISGKKFLKMIYSCSRLVQHFTLTLPVSKSGPYFLGCNISANCSPGQVVGCYSFLVRERTRTLKLRISP